MYQLIFVFIFSLSCLSFAENPETYHLEKLTKEIQDSVFKEKEFSKKIEAVKREHKKLEKIISSYEQSTNSDLLKELQSLMALEEILTRLQLKEKNTESCNNSKNEIEFADSTSTLVTGLKKTKSPETTLGLQLLENICSK